MARTRGEIRAAGPVDGMVLVAVDRPDGSVVLLVNARTGVRTVLRRSPDRIDAVAFDRLNRAWTWATITSDDQASLWAAPLEDGEPARLAGPREAYVSILTADHDGGRVAWWGLAPGGIFASVVDTTTGTVSAVDEVRDEVVGFLGDRLVWYCAGSSELSYPVCAVNPATGIDDVIWDGPGSFAAIAIGSDGDPRLIIHRQVDQVWRYAAVDVNDGVTDLDGDPAGERTAAMTSTSTGWETPGFVPVLPSGQFLDRNGRSVADQAVFLAIPPAAAPLPTPSISPTPAAAP